MKSYFYSGLRIFLTFLFFGIILYATASFAMLSFNPAKWGEVTRFIMSFIFLFGSVLACSLNDWYMD